MEIQLSLDKVALKSYVTSAFRDCFKSQKDETAAETTTITSFRHLQHHEPGGCGVFMGLCRA